MVNEHINASQAREINRELSLMDAELDRYFRVTGQVKLPGSIHLTGLPDLTVDDDPDPMKALLEALKG